MTATPSQEVSDDLWTLRKAVTTLAIAPETESLTRNGRLTYNVMIFKAQRMAPDAEGGFSAPISEIVKGFGATTRDSTRVRGYIEQMCRTVVRWFPLAGTDESQIAIAGIEPAPAVGDGRIFSLLAEARMSTRGGEQWVTWFYPPTIRDMLIQPSRWAQIDIKELATLSHYAAVALYEICARYRDVPGGLTNRAAPQWWAQTLKSDPDSKMREWRKFKNETLKPAMAEINQRTRIEVELVEHKQGRAVVSVQFSVRRKASDAEPDRPDLKLVERAVELGIKERDLDAMLDEFGEPQVEQALDIIEGRLRAQPTMPISNRHAYLRKLLRSGARGSVFEPPSVPIEAPPVRPEPQAKEEGASWIERRIRELNTELDLLPPDEIERYAQLAQAQLSDGTIDVSLRKRFLNKQYRSPLIWARIRAVYASEKYGRAWDRTGPESGSRP